MKDASADLKDPLITTPSFPESMSGDEDGSEEEMYTDSLTAHTRASDSTSADLLTSTASAREDISSIPPSVTESQFSSIMPYLEESTQPDQAHDIVFAEQSSQQLSDSTPQDTLPTSPLELQAQRRSARSTKGAPLCIWGRYIHTTQLYSKLLKHPNLTNFVTCTPNTPNG